MSEDEYLEWINRIKVRPSLCPYDPRVMVETPGGMYHCPVCGEMVLAGCEHPGVLEVK